MPYYKVGYKIFIKNKVIYVCSNCIEAYFVSWYFSLLNDVKIEGYFTYLD